MPNERFEVPLRIIHFDDRPPLREPRAELHRFRESLTQLVDDWAPHGLRSPLSLERWALIRVGSTSGPNFKDASDLQLVDSHRRARLVLIDGAPGHVSCVKQRRGQADHFGKQAQGRALIELATVRITADPTRTEKHVAVAVCISAARRSPDRVASSRHRP
jgi:hypothetical protein